MPLPSSSTLRHLGIIFTAAATSAFLFAVRPWQWWKKQRNSPHAFPRLNHVQVGTSNPMHIHNLLRQLFSGTHQAYIYHCWLWGYLKLWQKCWATSGCQTLATMCPCSREGEEKTHFFSCLLIGKGFKFFCVFELVLGNFFLSTGKFEMLHFEPDLSVYGYFCHLWGHLGGGAEEVQGSI